MKKIKGTKYYDSSGILLSEQAFTTCKPGYLLQKTIRCSICKKIDRFAETKPAQMPHLISDSFGVYILRSEIYLRGDSWYYIPDTPSHSTCREVYELGLYL